MGGVTVGVAGIGDTFGGEVVLAGSVGAALAGRVDGASGEGALTGWHAIAILQKINPTKRLVFQILLFLDMASPFVVNESYQPKILLASRS